MTPAVVDEICSRVERLLADVRPTPIVAASIQHALAHARGDRGQPAALAHALAAFRLSDADARVLTALVATERSAAIRTLCSIGSGPTRAHACRR